MNFNIATLLFMFLYCANSEIVKVKTCTVADNGVKVSIFYNVEDKMINKFLPANSTTNCSEIVFESEESSYDDFDPVLNENTKELVTETNDYEQERCYQLPASLVKYKKLNKIVLNGSVAAVVLALILSLFQIPHFML